MRLFLFFLFILMLTNSIFAIVAPTGEDPVTGKPIYETNTEEVTIDNTKKQITLPSGKVIIVDVVKKESELPEDLEMMGVDTVEVPPSDNNQDTGEDLPEDMADILGDDGGDTATTDGGASPPSSDDGSVSSPDVTNTEDGTVSTDSSVTEPPQNSGDPTLKILWFVMAVLVFLLIVTVVYMKSTKKEV